MPGELKPIPRELCKACRRPVAGYYDARARHMASAYRSGVTVERIALAYGLHADGHTALEIISEQLGREAVLEIQRTYWAER